LGLPVTIRLRALSLRVTTSEGPVSADLRFSSGLTVLRAPNNSGKSTALQAVVYAFGLEGMFSASREIPLPHVMTDRVEVEGREVPVVQSHVSLEVENAQGDIRTFQRAVVDPVLDRHVIVVWLGPQLTASATVYERQDYFVRRSGSARRELGFHHYLAEFIGWELPTVPHYDGSESPLYMEALFPLFYVEQKQGWGGVRPRMPTYLGIRDVGRRAVEFITDLTTLDRARLRAELEDRLRQVADEWSAHRVRLDVAVRREGGQLVGLPSRPTSWSAATKPRATFLIDDQPTDLSVVRQQIERELAETSAEPPTVGEEAASLAEELAQRQSQLREAVARSGALEEALDLAETELAALDRRIQATREDRQRLTDVRLLQSLGSPLGIDALAAHDCPTCHQALDRIEVSEDEIPLALDDNIRLLEERLVTLTSMRDGADANTSNLTLALSSARGLAASLRLRIRAIKAALVQPESSPSIAAIERRLTIERRLDDLQQLDGLLAVTAEGLERLANRSDLLRSQIAEVSGEFSATDQRKLRFLQESLREQLREYGFGSLPPDEVFISAETLHPAHEGFDLSFDISASDTIRTKWAYFLALAELSAIEATHHSGLVIFDEPGQQEIDRSSLVALIHRATAVARGGHQVILATSEDEDFIRDALEGEQAALQTPGAKLLQRRP
jgi:hypothetical protein